jgi:hypothetical protein
MATEAVTVYQQRLEVAVATTATTAINSRSWRYRSNNSYRSNKQQQLEI